MGYNGNNIFTDLKNLIFPRVCLFCGSDDGFICYSCRKEILIKPIRLCPVCKLENCIIDHKSEIDNLWTLADYHGWGIEKIVADIKYKYLVGLLDDFWYFELDNFYSKYKNYIDGKLIIPIPLHRQKFLRRGFNQAELIGLILNKLSSNSQISTNLLIRIKNNPSQVGKSGDDRYNNVKGIFLLDYRKLSKFWGCDVILIDDVYTTGATVMEAAKELKRHGFKNIDCLTLAVSRS